MKNIYFYLLFLFMCSKSFGQGTDYIFMLDNSPFMTEMEYTVMKTNIETYISAVLTCDPNNRVAVVQYGGVISQGIAFGAIYIESDFTNDVTVASSFIRRSLGGNDFAYESLSDIGYALDGLVLPGAHGFIKTLTQNPNNSLVVFLYSDARPAHLNSSLTNYNNPDPNVAFLNYTNFKNNRNASFMTYILWSPSEYFGAAIASVGGPYTGVVTFDPSDPDGAGTTGRYLFNYGTTDDVVINSLCSINCKRKITLSSPLQDVNAGSTTFKQGGSILAQNIISSTSTAIYRGGKAIDLKHGFHSVNGSTFRAYLNEDCNDVSRLSMEVGVENIEDFTEIEKEVQLFTLSPNPAADRTVIASDKMMAHVEVKSLTGAVFFSGKVNDKSHELYIGNYPKGFYMVMVTTDTGEVEVKKLIKD